MKPNQSLQDLKSSRLQVWYLFCWKYCSTESFACNHKHCCQTVIIESSDIIEHDRFEHNLWSQMCCWGEEGISLLHSLLFPFYFFRLVKKKTDTFGNEKWAVFYLCLLVVKINTSNLQHHKLIQANYTTTLIVIKQNAPDPIQEFKQTTAAASR